MSELPAKESAQAKTKVVLSSDGDKDKRQYPPWLSILTIAIIYALTVASAMLPLILSIFFALLCFGLVPKFVLLGLFLLISLDVVLPRHDGYHPDRKSKYMWQRIAAEAFQLYFPGRSIFLAKNLSPDKAYILATWPHGLLGGGNQLGMVEFIDQEGVYPVYSGASIVRHMPFLGRIDNMFGLVDVSKQGLSKVLDVKKYGPTYPNNVVHLLVGGIEEMFYTPYGADAEQIVLSKRKGFIKLALQTQADIIPQYTFGANQTYRRIFGPKSILCRLSKRFRVSMVVWFDRFWIPLGFIPIQTPILTVTGPVFEVPKVDSPEQITRELVAQVHADFCQALRSLYNEYRVVYVEEMGADESWLTRELLFENECMNDVLAT